MSRPDPRVLSPAEQAETDRVAEAVLTHLRRLLRAGSGVNRSAHEAWVQQQLGLPHGETCDCGECLR